MDIIDPVTGTNAFWIAAFYGRGATLAVLAEAGINLFVVHNKTKSNALHVAIERKHFGVASMLVKSNFPVWDTKEGGFSPLMLLGKETSKEALSLAQLLI